VVRTKLGLTLISGKTGEERVYHIVENEVSSMRKGALRSDARLDEDAVAEGEALESNILSQDFALVRSSYQKFTKLPFRG